MIEARAIGFRHSADAPWLFSDLSFALDRGQTLVLLGRNGRGKTTLIKCMAGLLTPSTGAIDRLGIAGYVPQNFAPAFSYSVFDVVLMGRARHIGLFSNPTAADRGKAMHALDQLGLAGLAGRSVTTLSGGERQLVLIARALASEADVLLLDEPASALDFRNQAVVLQTLRRLAAERGIAVVMTTHEPTHALQIADRAVLLHGDGVAEEGPVSTICTESSLSRLYGMRMKRLEDQAGDHRTEHVVADYASIVDPAMPS
ncbi:ABC transporter ATP-binding protein [Mesorhizobium sp. CAU 1741]|uniref:ABC transporter ATP-binding protein n=1 Tax=Mesorhizobium sp. CAU 1741 TaxID=3140366 RepID=UPI00325B1AB0